MYVVNESGHTNSCNESLFTVEYYAHVDEMNS